jgi:hypothetical protein
MGYLKTKFKIINQHKNYMKEPMYSPWKRTFTLVPLAPSIVRFNPTMMLINHLRCIQVDFKKIIV